MELKTETGASVALGEEIGRGGRGSVYAAFGGKKAVKVFKGQSRTERRRKKVACERKLAKTCEASVAWPLDDVFEDGSWAGYTMNRIVGRGLDEVSHDEDVSFVDRARYALEVCIIVDDLHKSGIVMGDLSLSNFVASWGRRSKVVAIDPDSFQVKDDEEGVCYPTTESREKSLEMIDRGNLGTYFLTSRSDDFLLACAVFELLFGVHPLDDGRSDVSPAQCRQQNAKSRTFAFLERPGAKLSSVGKDLDALFMRSFAGDGKVVPAASEYALALGDLLDELYDELYDGGGPFMMRALAGLARIVGVVFPAAVALLCLGVLAFDSTVLFVETADLKGCVLVCCALAAGSALFGRWFSCASIAATALLLGYSDAAMYAVYTAPDTVQAILCAGAEYADGAFEGASLLL